MEKTFEAEGRYRVLLKGIEDDSPEKRESFCRQISEKYHVSFSLLENILDRCPIILKKNLTFRKAQGLARTLKQYGGQISLEEKRGTLPILLEFQQAVPRRLALESARFSKTQGGTWSVTGRIRNISNSEVSDVWVLIQLFEKPETLLTFDEAPIVLNPLPAGESSPFRVLLDGDLAVWQVSVAFKNSAGVPLASEDRRKVEEWDEVKIGDEGDRVSRYAAPLAGGELRPVEVTESLDGEGLVHGSSTAGEIPQSHAIEAAALPALKEEKSPEAALVRALEGPLPASETMITQEVSIEPSLVAPPGGEETELENKGESTEQGAVPEELPESPPKEGLDVSVFQEASKLLNEIERRIEQKSEPDLPPFPWMDQFRDAIRRYHLEPRDSFVAWFQTNKKEGRFEGDLHALVTVLAHARFDQAGEEGKGLDNTKRVAPLIMRSKLSFEEIPVLEATEHFSAESWGRFFHKAIPRLQVIGRDIAAKDTWDAADLERLIQVIPHMSGQTSRRAVRWMSQLVPEVITIDFSKTALIIGESLFRVATRLGVVTPQFDTYQDPASRGYAKIQSFSKLAFPEDPLIMEEPMTYLGMNGSKGGHCTPIQPHCEGCLFEGFCPRLHSSRMRA